MRQTAEHHDADGIEDGLLLVGSNFGLGRLVASWCSWSSPNKKPAELVLSGSGIGGGRQLLIAVRPLSAIPCSVGPVL